MSGGKRNKLSCVLEFVAFVLQSILIGGETVAGTGRQQQTDCYGDRRDPNRRRGPCSGKITDISETGFGVSFFLHVNSRHFAGGLRSWVSSLFCKLCVRSTQRDKTQLSLCPVSIYRRESWQSSSEIPTSRSCPLEWDLTKGGMSWRSGQRWMWVEAALVSLLGGLGLEQSSVSLSLSIKNVFLSKWFALFTEQGNLFHTEHSPDLFFSAGVHFWGEGFFWPRSFGRWDQEICGLSVQHAKQGTTTSERRSR